MITLDKIRRLRQALARRGVELSIDEVTMFQAPPPTDPTKVVAYDRLNIKVGEAIGFGEFGPKLFLPLESFCREVNQK